MLKLIILILLLAFYSCGISSEQNEEQTKDYTEGLNRYVQVINEIPTKGDTIGYVKFPVLTVVEFSKNVNSDFEETQIVRLKNISNYTIVALKYRYSERDENFNENTIYKKNKTKISPQETITITTNSKSEICRGIKIQSAVLDNGQLIDLYNLN